MEDPLLSRIPGEAPRWGKSRETGIFGVHTDLLQQSAVVLEEAPQAILSLHLVPGKSWINPPFSV
jgi:hypothetical protein